MTTIVSIEDKLAKDQVLVGKAPYNGGTEDTILATIVNKDGSISMMKFLTAPVENKKTHEVYDGGFTKNLVKIDPNDVDTIVDALQRAKAIGLETRKKLMGIQAEKNLADNVKKLGGTMKDLAKAKDKESMIQAMQIAMEQLQATMQTLMGDSGKTNGKGKKSK